MDSQGLDPHLKTKRSSHTYCIGAASLIGQGYILTVLTPSVTRSRNIRRAIMPSTRNRLLAQAMQYLTRSYQV